MEQLSAVSHQLSAKPYARDGRKGHNFNPAHPVANFEFLKLRADG
jgi:hypothetical protein